MVDRASGKEKVKLQYAIPLERSRSESRVEQFFDWHGPPFGPFFFSLLKSYEKWRNKCVLHMLYVFRMVKQYQTRIWGPIAVRLSPAPPTHFISCRQVTKILSTSLSSLELAIGEFPSVSRSRRDCTKFLWWWLVMVSIAMKASIPN